MKLLDTNIRRLKMGQFVNLMLSVATLVVVPLRMIAHVRAHPGRAAVWLRRLKGAALLLNGAIVLRCLGEVVLLAVGLMCLATYAYRPESALMEWLIVQVRGNLFVTIVRKTYNVDVACLIAYNVIMLELLIVVSNRA